MIDSHAHLDLCAGPLAELVADADAAGVRRVLAVGLDGASSRAALAAAEAFPQVRAAVGRHPNGAEGFDEADRTELEALASHPGCAAIGETGFDFYRQGAPRADQERAFRAQIEVARATGKPLVIHTRAADGPTLTVLDDAAEGLQVILHCFSMPERLDDCLARGFWISFAGNLTYPNAPALRAAAARVPAERLLVETDAPFLAPQPLRGRPNRPAHVVQTAQLVARERGESYAELERSVERNAAELFGW